MTTRDNDQTRHPDWAPDCKCGVCHTCIIPITIPPNVHLGEN